MANILSWLIFPVLALEIELTHPHNFFWFRSLVLQQTKKGETMETSCNTVDVQSWEKDFTIRAIILWEKVPKEVVESSPLEMFKTWPKSWATWAALALLWAGIQMKCPREAPSDLNYCIILWKHSEISCAERNSSKTKRKPRTLGIY